MICHAYNMQGQKCDLLYEHDDDHEFTIKWTNAECWTPEKQFGTTPNPMLYPTIPPEEEVQVLGPVPTYGEGKAGTCLLCQHGMHGGECARCDCKAGIPA